MDLSILVGGTILYIRVAGLIKTPRGFLFEKKSDREYVFALGGKVMINETSKEAMKREIMEEIGIEVGDLTLCSVIENLYTKATEKVHEICFVYKINTIFTGVIPDGFVEVPIEDIDKFDVRPSPVVGILKGKENSFKHIILK